MTSGRALRAGLLTTVLVSGFWGLVGIAMSGDGCTSRPTNPYPCLGGQVLVVVVGLPVLALLVALTLAGRGVLHAVAGGVVSLGVGLLVVYTVLGAVDYGGPNALGLALAGPVAGLTAGAWSAWGPGRAPRERSS